MMTLEQLYEIIKLCPEARQTVEEMKYSGPWSVMDAWNMFHGCQEEFFHKIQAHREARQLFLYYYCQFACLTYGIYQKNNIPEDVFQDTFRDIARWEEACFSRTGVHGLEEYEWLSYHMKLKLFGLGRLQFQPIPSPRNIAGTADLKAGQMVLNVHIPAGGTLKDKLVQDSYKKAEGFFQMSPTVFVCHSWLLSPALQELLDPDSNIMRFQKEYHILEVEEDSRQAEERIFGWVSENPEDYPQNSQLQKKAREWLMNGRSIPSGYGIRRM